MGVASSGLRALDAPCFSGQIAGGGRQEAAYVLDHDELGLYCLDRGRHVRPEPRAGAGCEAGAFPDGGDVLAGKSSAQDLDGLDLAPADGGDVAEVRGVGPVVGEDAGDGLVDLGEPDRLAADDVLDGEVETAVSAEQRPDPWLATVRGEERMHEGSRQVGYPDFAIHIEPHSPGRSPAGCTAG